MARIPLTPKIVAELKSLKEQTGVGAIALLRGQKNYPKGINAGIINAWLSGKCKTANERHLDFVLKAWKAQTPRIKITDKIYKEIRAEMQRTGSTASVLINRLPPVHENSLTITVGGYFHGKFIERKVFE